MLTFKYNKAGWMSMVGLGLALGCGSLSGLCASEAAAPAPVVVSDDDWIFDEKDNLFFFKTVLDQKSARIIEWRNERWLIEAQSITLIQTPAVNPMPRFENGLSDKQLIDGMLRRMAAPIQVSDTVVVAEAAPSISLGLNFDFGSDHGGHHDNDGPINANPHHAAGFGNDVIMPNPSQTPTAPGPQIVPGSFGTTVAQPVNQTLPTGTNGNGSTGNTNTGNSGNTVPGSNPGSTGMPGSNGNAGNSNNSNGNTGTGSNGGRGINTLQNDLQNDLTDAKNLTQRNIDRARDVQDVSNERMRKDWEDVKQTGREGVDAAHNTLTNSSDAKSLITNGEAAGSEWANNAANRGKGAVDRYVDNSNNTATQTTEGAKDTANTLGQDATKTAQDGVNTLTDAAQNTGSAAQNAWNNATSNPPHIGSNPNNVPPKGWNNNTQNAQTLMNNSKLNNGMEPVRTYQPVSNNFNNNTYTSNTSKSGNSSLKGNAPTYTQQNSQNFSNMQSSKSVQQSRKTR